MCHFLSKSSHLVQCSVLSVPHTCLLPLSFPSDMRFIEVVENVCKRLLEYNLHKERTGSNRFAKVQFTPNVLNGRELRPVDATHQRTNEY